MMYTFSEVLELFVETDERPELKEDLKAFGFEIFTREAIKPFSFFDFDMEAALKKAQQENQKNSRNSYRKGKKRGSRREYNRDRHEPKQQVQGKNLKKFQLPTNNQAGLIGELEETSFQMSKVEKKEVAVEGCWFYKDDDNNVQGPWDSASMDRWYASGYFHNLILLRYKNDAAFTSLEARFSGFDGVSFVEAEQRCKQRGKKKPKKQQPKIVAQKPVVVEKPVEEKAEKEEPAFGAFSSFMEPNKPLSFDFNANQNDSFWDSKPSFSFGSMQPADVPSTIVPDRNLKDVFFESPVAEQPAIEVEPKVDQVEKPAEKPMRVIVPDPEPIKPRKKKKKKNKQQHEQSFSNNDLPAANRAKNVTKPAPKKTTEGIVVPKAVITEKPMTKVEKIQAHASNVVVSKVSKPSKNLLPAIFGNSPSTPITAGNKYSSNTTPNNAGAKFSSKVKVMKVKPTAHQFSTADFFPGMNASPTPVKKQAGIRAAETTSIKSMQEEAKRTKKVVKKPAPVAAGPKKVKVTRVQKQPKPTGTIASLASRLSQKAPAVNVEKPKPKPKKPIINVRVGEIEVHRQPKPSAKKPVVVRNVTVSRAKKPVVVAVEKPAQVRSTKRSNRKGVDLNSDLWSANKPKKTTKKTLEYNSLSDPFKRWIRTELTSLSSGKLDIDINTFIDMVLPMDDSTTQTLCMQTLRGRKDRVREFTTEFIRRRNFE
ncbi:hypothetical protein PCE1_004821 [Barthelona sp. PCE]